MFTMFLSSSLLLTGNTGLIVGPRSSLLCAADLARRRQLLRRRCRNASYGWKRGRRVGDKKKHQKNARCDVFSLCGHVTSAFPSLPDKNFEDDDSVDGGRSSSSSKGASQCGRKPVSMGSFRRPSSASSAKSAGENWKKNPLFLNISPLCCHKGPPYLL